MAQPQGPIDFLIHKQGKKLTEQDVKDALNRAASNPEFVRRLVKAHATSPTDEAIVSSKRNGPPPTS